MITIKLDSADDKIELSSIDEHVQWTYHDTAFVFDFDGVISSPAEDAVYGLPVRRHEKAQLTKIAVHYGFRPEMYDGQYLRHLVFQAILADRGIPVQPGPLADVAAQLSQAGAPIYILSARSGHAAVHRALEFLRSWGTRAQETFFIGRVGKGRQLAHLKTLPGIKHLVYFDDSIRHTRNAFEQRIKGILAIHVGWRDVAVREDAINLLEQQLSWFEGGRHGTRRLESGTTARTGIVQHAFKE